MVDLQVPRTLCMIGGLLQAGTTTASLIHEGQGNAGRSIAGSSSSTTTTSGSTSSVEHLATATVDDVDDPLVNADPAPALTECSTSSADRAPQTAIQDTAPAGSADGADGAALQWQAQLNALLPISAKAVELAVRTCMRHMQPPIYCSDAVAASSATASTTANECSSSISSG
jgi:hypothetical protein